MLTMKMSTLKSFWLERVTTEGKVMHSIRQYEALDGQRPKETAESLPITNTISMLKKVIALKDFETASHIERLGFYSYRLSLELQMDEVFCGNIYHASQLHDIGKLALPDSLLNKKGPLTPSEFDEVKTHTVLGQKMLGAGEGDIFKMACDIALCHHERWDGTGYPFGTEGADIPVASRIVILVDQYDALRSKRVYKDGFSHDKVLRILTMGDGRTMPYHFDPEVLAAFKRIHEEFDDIFESYNESAMSTEHARFDHAPAGFDIRIMSGLPA